jgi:transposase
MKPQQQYVGLDVSLEQTSVCVVDDTGATIWRGKCSSTPESIRAVVAKHASEAVRIGLETGQLSTWLFHELRARQLPGHLHRRASCKGRAVASDQQD